MDDIFSYDRNCHIWEIWAFYFISCIYPNDKDVFTCELDFITKFLKLKKFYVYYFTPLVLCFLNCYFSSSLDGLWTDATSFASISKNEIKNSQNYGNQNGSRSRLCLVAFVILLILLIFLFILYALRWPQTNSYVFEGGEHSRKMLG